MSSSRLAPLLASLCFVLVLAPPLARADARRAAGESADKALQSREALVVLTGRAELTGLASRTPPARRAELMQRKRAVAEQQQASLLAWLAARGIEHRAFWIANAIWVRATDAELRVVASRADVAGVAANPHVEMKLPRPEAA